jgi:hypothetical protein
MSEADRRTDYAECFADLLSCNLAILHTDAFIAKKRTWQRRKSACDFGETDLQQLIDDRTRRILPPGCPELYVDKEHKRIDYTFFRAPNEILATCQLKGPLRRSAASRLENGFGAILEDIAKQRREAELFPDLEHYIGILFCFDRALTEHCMSQLWLPALQAEMTAALFPAATRDTGLLNGQTLPCPSFG